MKKEEDEVVAVLRGSERWVERMNSGRREDQNEVTHRKQRLHAILLFCLSEYVSCFYWMSLKVGGSVVFV